MDSLPTRRLILSNVMSATPTFSVIVVCKNPGARLHVTLASIWEQRNATLELIVVDGSSTDGSREWLEMRREQIAVLTSEPDLGVYDAMNKGVAAARGEWIFFLGADDRLTDESVLSKTESRLRKTDSDAVSGEAVFDDGRSYTLHAPVNPLARNFVHHQATFYRRSLLAKTGGFDTSLTIMADYELNLRLWKGGVRFEPIPLRAAPCRDRVRRAVRARAGRCGR